VFRKSFIAHKEHIDDNPVKVGLAARAQYYPYFSAYLCKKKKASGPLCRSATLREGLRQQGVVLLQRWTA
jgi:hypothetical protein